MAKPNKENIITDILIELGAGTSYKDCFKVILSKFKLSEPTFVTYWKEANIRHLENQQAIQKQLADQNTEAEKERLKTAILTKEKALEILTDIAFNADREADRISSLKTMADIQGWKAPIKTENTNIDKTPIFGDNPLDSKE